MSLHQWSRRHRSTVKEGTNMELTYLVVKMKKSAQLSQLTKSGDFTLGELAHVVSEGSRDLATVIIAHGII